MLFDRQELEHAAKRIYQEMNPTPQYAWPLLSQSLGLDVILKHENHAPTGAFKVRGGITFMDWLRKTHPDVQGIITATRGNHGQSQARAASNAGLKAKIYVPFGNSSEKNAAMRAFGGEVVEFGDDFIAAGEEAKRVAEREGLFLVPSFHKEIVRGVATYGLELLASHPDLDVIYVPIGLGSGICGTIAARDALGLQTEIVGVVSEGAQGAKLSFEKGALCGTDAATSFADGVAVRRPNQEAFEIYRNGASRIIAVSDSDIAEAARLLFRTTHNAAEGAGAIALAGAMIEREKLGGKKVAAILSGGNIDSEKFAELLTGHTPRP